MFIVLQCVHCMNVAGVSLCNLKGVISVPCSERQRRQEELIYLVIQNGSCSLVGIEGKQVGVVGKDLFAVFSELTCSSCHAIIGKKYHSLPKAMEYFPIEVSLIWMTKVLLYDPQANNYVNDVKGFQEFSMESESGVVQMPKQELGCRGKVKDNGVSQSFKRQQSIKRIVGEKQNKMIDVGKEIERVQEQLETRIDDYGVGKEVNKYENESIAQMNSTLKYFGKFESIFQFLESKNKFLKKQGLKILAQASAIIHSIKTRKQH